MDIVAVRPEHVEPLHAIYVAQTRRAPHCRFVPDQTQFRDDILKLAARLRPAPQQAQVFVAEAHGAVEGFATLTTYADDDEEGRQRQAITGLFVALESAAHELINTCEAYATSDELLAFPPTHSNTVIQTYNVGWDGLSSHVPGVARALAQHGYTPFARELHMVALLDTAQHGARPLPPMLTLDGPKQQSSPYGWSQIVRAMDGETRVGLCSFSDLRPVTDQQEAKRTGYIWGLGVNNEYRQRGIGRALVTAAMQHLGEQGCTECWLTTAADNWAAQPLYYSMGFEVVDCSVSFRKRLRS